MLNRFFVCRDNAALVTHLVNKTGMCISVAIKVLFSL